MPSRSSNEDGAVAVIVALCLLLIFGAAAISVDLGSAWETKRDLVVDTDAAALAGARALIGGGCADALQAAEEFLETNTGQVSIALTQDVDFDCDHARGTVRVDWTSQAQQTLSGALGHDVIEVFGSSTAHVADGFPGGGLRPFSVCMTDPDVSAWIAGGAGTLHRLDIDKTWKSKASDNCQGGAPGNWGYVCYQKHKYNSGSCDANALANLVINGYDGPVDLESSDPADGDCDPEGVTSQDCDPITGSINSSGFQTALDEIKCDPVATPSADDCKYQFAVLGVNSFTGNGSTAKIHPTHFVGVVLRDWHIHGSSGYLDFELVNLFDEGASSVLDHGTLSEPQIALCGADHVGDFCG